MRQGTTPSYIVTVDGYDLTNMAVFVTLKDKYGHLVTKTNDKLSIVLSENNSVIAFRLTQQETFTLSVGEIEIQVRFIDENNIAYATDIATVSNLNVLLKKVIEYEGE